MSLREKYSHVQPGLKKPRNFVCFTVAYSCWGSLIYCIKYSLKYLDLVLAEDQKGSLHFGERYSFFL